MDRTTDEQIETAVAVAMQAPQNVLRELFIAVYAYRDTKDTEPLIRLAEDAIVTVELHSSSAYQKALANAPTQPTRRGRSVKEIFAAYGH